jgi:hypothetical protein
MRTIHDHSTAAYLQERPRLSARERLIFDHLLTIGKPRSDRHISHELGFGNDLNCVRPRISELIDKGLLQEVGSKICKRTGKRVRLVRAINHLIED